MKSVLGLAVRKAGFASMRGSRGSGQPSKSVGRLFLSGGEVNRQAAGI